MDFQHDQLLAWLGLPGGAEWVLILAAGLLLFGRRLPEIARSMGKGIVEFKKGLRDVEDEIDRASSSTSRDDNESSYDDTGYGQDAYGDEVPDDSDATTRQKNYEEIYGQSDDADSGAGSSDEADTRDDGSNSNDGSKSASSDRSGDATAAQGTSSSDEIAAESGKEHP